ncbi:MAG TPA: carboxypeptidase regulatory-like domain-containing protein, partial [Haliangium sp.]|nr:carboxypeptidase regulatory-like domain-containing protein [Haliangium sp.]
MTTGTLRGRVIDAATGAPLPGALVSAGAATRLTDADGRFTLPDVPLGQVEVMATTDIHSPQIVTVSLSAALPVADVELALSATAVMTGEVVEIVGEAPDPAAPPSYDLQAAEIRVLPGSGNDTLKALQSLPGVARVPFGLGGLVLRGASPRDTNVYLDGVEVPLLYHFGGLASFFPSSMLTSLEMVPGGFSAEFGRAQGGVVVMRSRPGRGDRWRVESEVSLQDAAVRADGPAPLGGAWSVGLRRSYVDAVLALALPEDGAFSLTLAPRYYDGQLRYDLDIGGGQRLSAMVFGSDDRLSFLFEDDDDPAEMSQSGFRWVQRFARAALRWERRIDDVLLSATPWIGWDESSIRVGDEGVIRENVPAGGRIDAVRTLPGGYLAGGIDLQGGRFGVDIANEPPPMPGAEDPDGEVMTSNGAEWFLDAGFWVEGLYGLWDGQVNVKPGLRIERYGLSEEWAIDPRLNLAQPLPRGVTLKQSVGVYHQPPNPPDLDPVFGNERLGSSYAVQTSAGVEWKLPAGVEITATGFFDQAWDVPVDVVSTATGAAEPGNALSGGGGAASRELSTEQFGTYSYQENVGRGRNYGMETLIRGVGGAPGRAGSWMGWISYTLSRALRRYDPARYPDYLPYVLDQPHVLTALGSLLVTDDWRLGARVRFVSGNPITPVTGSYYDAEDQEYRATSGAILSERLPAFFQLDLRVDRTWKRSWGTLSLFLDVQNVTNRGNPEGVSYNYDFTERAYTTGLP